MKGTWYLMLCIASFGCFQAQTPETITRPSSIQSPPSSFLDSLSEAALTLIDDQVRYDPSYFSLDYPNGDVPANVGVCTDVIIRTYRKMNIDLQVLVHEDMKVNFSVYPSNWGLTGTDRNIDHRRVPNLMKFFERSGAEIPISLKPTDYKPGDVVSWDLGNGITHIGVVVNSYTGDRPHIVHNIGGGQILQDCLFDFEIIGHYRFDRQLTYRL